MRSALLGVALALALTWACAHALVGHLGVPATVYSGPTSGTVLVPAAPSPPVIRARTVARSPARPRVARPAHTASAPAARRHRAHGRAPQQTVAPRRRSAARPVHARVAAAPAPATATAPQPAVAPAPAPAPVPPAVVRHGARRNAGVPPGQAKKAAGAAGPVAPPSSPSSPPGQSKAPQRAAEPPGQAKKP